MLAYHLTPEAQKDILEIRRYTTEQWGKPQSQKYLSELRQTIRLLAENPNLGKQRSDVSSGVSSFPHASHVIYYIVHRQQLIVFGVLHKRMVPDQHLADRPII
ncbi:type II toxin-antitoxin system RelE/ParE family toxin [Kordiimonas lipolytica]|uniref:Toxin n=1 Tax=Kordiimonas lipolytica TaxID=1662421 RepID=A0ABV8U6J6_9PROT|nr:type II toxin-antitoxin system RelE/ParE family toxin [Kordiimonas lipolytica]